MSLVAYALTTVEKLKRWMRATDTDFNLPAISLYNNSADATGATVQITDTAMILVVTAGANAGTSTLTFADANKDTITELVTAINALAKGWVAVVLNNGDQASTDLNIAGATSCLLIANIINLYLPNNLLLEELINSATDLIERITGRRFIATTYTLEEYDGPGACDLLLKNFPINTVTAFKRYYSDGTDDDLDLDDVSIYHNEGYIYYRPGLVEDRKAYLITYNAGYSTIPNDLSELCNQLVTWKYNTYDKDGIASERTMNYSVAYADPGMDAGLVPAEIMKKIMLWKRFDF